MTTYTESLTTSVSRSEPEVRATFIKKTYAHLSFAILLFITIEVYLLQSSVAKAMVETMIGGKWSWMIVLGMFIGVSWLANSWASRATSPAIQYAGLGLFIVAEAVVFLPLLYIASSYYEGIILQAGAMTALLFCGLTLTVFTTGKDFSFLRPILSIGGMVALGIIFSGIAFGFDLGLFFSGLMILFASASILYETSNILHHYKPNQYVAASLSLFASVALLFWYILRFFMALGSD